MHAALFPMPELLVIDYGARGVRRVAELAVHANVVSAPSIADAGALLRTRRIDVVVTHHTCADGTVLDVCETAARVQPSASVLVTGLQMAHVPDAIAAGCDGILLSPVNTERLRSAVRGILRARRDPAGAVPRAPAATRRSRATIDYRAEIACPRCTTRGVYSSAPASGDRAWCSCTTCRLVWMVPRGRVDTPS
jgi:DNA-binding NarL/FixJ family response regulator